MGPFLPSRNRAAVGPLPFRFYDVDLGESEQIAQPSLHHLRDLDLAGNTVGLHACRRVHRVAPQVVRELALADHPGYGGPGGHPDPDAHLIPAGPPHLGDLVPHRERHLRGHLDVVLTGFGNAGDRHIRTHDRLDLLEPAALRDRVEPREHFIEYRHDLRRIRRSGLFRELYEISEPQEAG